MEEDNKERKNERDYDCIDAEPEEHYFGVTTHPLLSGTVVRSLQGRTRWLSEDAM